MIDIRCFPVNSVTGVGGILPLKYSSALVALWTGLVTGMIDCSGENKIARYKYTAEIL